MAPSQPLSWPESRVASEATCLALDLGHLTGYSSFKNNQEATIGTLPLTLPLTRILSTPAFWAAAGAPSAAQRRPIGVVARR